MKNNWNAKQWTQVAEHGTSGDQVWDLIADLEGLEERCAALLELRAAVIRYTSAETVDYPAFLQAHEDLDAACKSLAEHITAPAGYCGCWRHRAEEAGNA